MSADELERIFREHGDFVYRICFRYVSNREEAEDLTQDIFVMLSRKLRSFRGDCKITTWIYRLTINRCLDYLRHKKARKTLSLDDVHPAVLSNMDENQVLAKIDLGKILGKIKPSTRRILFLSFAEGLNYDEVAEITGASKSAIAKTVSRFREKIHTSRKYQQSGWEMERKAHVI